MKSAVLQHNFLNGWSLFYLIAALTAIVVGMGFSKIGIDSPQATIDMIGLSVRLASPWIYITFAVSPIMHFFPGNASAWLLRNRRYFGLAFAAGFAWQLVFIIVLLSVFPDYYWEQMHKTSELILRTVSYFILIALTITSFYPLRRRMQRQHWYWLHLFGVWFFWAAIWVSYTQQAFSAEATVLSFMYFGMGLLVFILRILAHLNRLQSR